MVFIGRRFVTVSENKNQAEAEFRYVLTRLSENGESIAVLGGEGEERNAVNASLRNVLRRWRDICWQTMRTTIVSQTSSYVAPVLPVLLCAPKFLDGSMSLGEVMQAASAFTIVQSAFNWLVDNYPRLADWTASARRVSSLMVSLDNLERSEESEDVGRIERSETEEAALRLRDLSVTLEDGTEVVKDAEVAIAPGERVLVAGESGTGKSTLVRAIAGLWPWGEGKVEVASGTKLLLMPQRAYVPVGTLRRAATYPEPAKSKSVAAVAKAFRLVGLDHLTEQIDEEGGPDAFRRREAAVGVRTNTAAPARDHRAGRGNFGARPCEPGQADGVADQGTRRYDNRERRASAGARSISQPQDHSRAALRWRQVRH
jgi:putative ATP-binding cassette transporter